MTHQMNSSCVVIGLDVGTTSVSAVAITQSGVLLKAVSINHEATVSRLPFDCAEQDPDRLLSACVVALEQLSPAIAGSRIAGIGLTGQMHSCILLDQFNGPLSNVVTWQDRRSLRSVNGGTLLQQLQAAATEQQMLNTGCRLSPGYMGTTLFSLQQLGQFPDGVAQVSFVADWIASWLTGRAPVTDRSHVAASGLYDLVKDDWNPHLLRAARINTAWLPAIRDSGVAIGNLNSDVAQQTGLPVGVPVCNAVGDNQASVLSCLPDSDAGLLINIGTGGQIVWRAGSFTRLPKLDTRPLPSSKSIDCRTSQTCMPAAYRTLLKDSSFMLVGAGLCGGDALAWVNRSIRTWLNAFGFDLTDQEVWMRLTDQFNDLPQDRLMTCEPFFRGTRQDPDRRGLIAGVDNDNFTPVNLAAAVLRGIAQSMFDVYRDSGRSEQQPAEFIVMSGNGARRNPLLVQEMQRCFGIPVTVSALSEEAAAGAAFLAGSRLGVWNSIDEAREGCLQCLTEAEDASASQPKAPL